MQWFKSAGHYRAAQTDAFHSLARRGVYPPPYLSATPAPPGQQCQPRPVNMKMPAQVDGHQAPTLHTLPEAQRITP